MDVSKINIWNFILFPFKLLYWYVEALYRQIIPLPMKSIDGETILVTGAVGGIGKEICKHIVRCGSNIKLVLWDLNRMELDKFSEELRMMGKGEGLEVFPFAVDISTRENVDECSKNVKNTVGPVSIIFNNAGIAPSGNFLQLKNEAIESTIQINLLSHFWIIRQFLPEMISKNKGRIVNICSAGGLRATHNLSIYYASKFAVNGYTQSLKMELDMLKCDGIHVTTVYPFFVNTPILKPLGVRVSKNAGWLVKCIFPAFQEAEQVAIKTVNGMRREYEHIYLPSRIRLFIAVENFLPRKARKQYLSFYQNYISFGDEGSQKVMSTPLSRVPITNGK